MATIKTLKLVTGEEIIGTVVSNVVGTDLVMEKVRTVQMVQAQPGHMGVALIPFSAADIDGEVTLYRPGIIAEIKHSKEMEDAYLQQTTGIQIATGSVPRK